ncbi:MAG TPA: hypothetical protein VG937_38760 [Polyangiaceae bacterium]|nr:hypothetical protein [Polyangiaceae bacterium]
MTIELARRLIGAGAPVAAVEAALSSEVADGTPFVTAISERFPELVPLVERELLRAEAPEINWVRPALGLVARLPPGMCERLLAIPVHQEAQGGRVDVAAVDTLGPHVAAEFAFHLQAAVRVLRAPAAQLRAALASLNTVSALTTSSSGERRPSTRPPPPLERAAPARGSRPPPAIPSEPPIPLVRRPPVSNRAATPEEEPVLNLSRSKFFAPEAPFVFERSLEEAVLEFGRADSAEQVARLLCRALEPAVSLVVAVRGGSMELRAASRAVSEAAQSSFSLPTGKNSVFDVAVRAGFYLGPLPSGIVHAELRSFLPSAALDEVYSAPVLVANRPVLALLMARFGPSLDATRRADRLILAASAAIERILISKKRGAGG